MSASKVFELVDGGKASPTQVAEGQADQMPASIGASWSRMQQQNNLHMGTTLTINRVSAHVRIEYCCYMPNQVLNSHTVLFYSFIIYLLLISGLCSTCTHSLPSTLTNLLTPMCDTDTASSYHVISVVIVFSHLLQ